MAIASHELDGTAELHLVLPAHPDLARVVAGLGSPEAPWLGEPEPPTGAPYRRFACDLEFQVGDHKRVTLRKSALVGLGEPRLGGDGWVIQIDWRAATFAPLFPVFAGSLRVEPDRLRLDGCYAPPGGRLGQALDAALLSVAARGTGRWFLRTVAALLDEPGSPRVDHARQT